MNPRLMHVYGPLWVNSYGLMIAIGFIVFCFCILNDKKISKLINSQTLVDLIFQCALIAFIGARALYVVEFPSDFSNNWKEILYPWVGGFSILGAIIANCIFIPFRLGSMHIPIIPFLDLIAYYVPLFQSIARLGCFFAGCCYGAPAPAAWWALFYTHPDSLAPCNIFLYPTQLYSSLLSLLIFIFMQIVKKKNLNKQGYSLFTFLLLEGIARFTVDFWRGERCLTSFASLSWDQIIALSLVITSLSFFITKNNNKG